MQDGIPWIGCTRMAALRRAHADVIDAMPAALLEPALGQRRSGRYFEALVVALVNADPRLELLAHDLQVRDAQRTVGAFDVLLRRAGSSEVTHLELAFKQYLLRGGDSEQAAHWVGPRGRDRLDRKTRHMQGHQLRLGATDAGRVALEAMGIDKVTPRALMAGRLFIHRDEFQAGWRPPLPPICSDTPELGWWCTGQDLEALRDSTASWRVLPPSYAIAPLNADDCNALSAPDWSALRKRVDDGQPCLVAELRSGIEVSRGWIVRRNT